MPLIVPMDLWKKIMCASIHVRLGKRENTGFLLFHKSLVSIGMAYQIEMLEKYSNKLFFHIFVGFLTQHLDLGLLRVRGTCRIRGRRSVGHRAAWGRSPLARRSEGRSRARTRCCRSSRTAPPQPSARAARHRPRTRRRRRRRRRSKRKPAATVVTGFMPATCGAAAAIST